MDDDNADWFAAADEPEAAPSLLAKSKTADKAKAAAAEESAADVEAPAAQEAPPAAAEAEGADEYLDPDKLLLFKHWIRPQYLQYKYIYDYRRSYYDSVLDAIERRRKGYRTNIPRPQTWAERVMRTYSNNSYRAAAFDQYLEDVKLVTRSEVSGRIYTSQSLSNFNKRFTTKINY